MLHENLGLLTHVTQFEIENILIALFHGQGLELSLLSSFVSPRRILPLAKNLTRSAQNRPEPTNLLHNSELEFLITSLSHAIIHRGRIVDAFV